MGEDQCMVTNGARRLSIFTNWRWLVVTYCFLILFDLFPAFLVFGLQTFFRPYGFWWFTLWAGGGMAIVSAYVGFRSRGITIFEPAIASLLYALTLLAAFEAPWKNVGEYHFVAFRIALLLFAFLIGLGAAAVGEWLQMRKERRLKLAGEVSEGKVGS
jgi:hypothetical protein